MKLGTPNNPRMRPEDEIAWAAGNGFDFIDLSLEPDLSLPEVVDPISIRRELDRLHLGVVGHMAWYLPIGSPMPTLRKASIDAAVAALEAFARIGSPNATIHTHWPAHLFSVKEGLALQIETLQALMTVSRRTGVQLMLEPAASWNDVPDNLAAIYDAVPGLACHLDLGHCNLNGFQPADWIRRFANRLVHVHAHDNNGREDQHLPPGTGTVDWPAAVRALKAAGYDGTITIESFSADRDYRCFGRDKIRRLWDSLP
jgi:sugar phosphate isomerase/epimerase